MKGEMMATETRYCGDVKIELEYLDTQEGRLQFGGKVLVGSDWWEFANVLVDQPEPTPEAFDIAAAGAIHYGSLYTSDYDPETNGGEIPDWAPPADFADTIVNNLEVDDRGYCIQREIEGPIVYSG